MVEFEFRVRYLRALLDLPPGYSLIACPVFNVLFYFLVIFYFTAVAFSTDFSFSSSVVLGFLLSKSLFCYYYSVISCLFNSLLFFAFLFGGSQLPLSVMPFCSFSLLVSALSCSIAVVSPALRWSKRICCFNNTKTPN